MPRKDVRRDTVVSDKCFRLLYLKQEIQTDMKVLKPVIDEVNVLRLCHSLGMTLSSEGDPDSMHKFEFGLFNSDDYDTDFARFIRENVLAGNSCKEQKKEREDNEILEIGCLFGKQLEVKNELTRMGFWDSGCEEGLSLKDQGVFCMKGSADRRQFVIFAWLGPSLFGPNAFRDTPAYVLRFLLTLSFNITCCLSQEDLRCIKSEVDAMSASSSMRWNSCSVAFRVQKQVKQEDSITYDVVTKMSIPKFSRIKSVWFVDGVIPSVAVENWAPSATEWITQHDVVSCGSFAQWLWEKHEEYLIELKPIQLHSTNAYDNVLRRFDKFPDEEMCALRGKYRDERAIAEQKLCLEAFEYASTIFDDAVRNADVLFAVRCFANTSEMDLVQRRYASFLQRCERFGECGRYQTYKMLYLPESIQMNMELLYATYRRHPSAFEKLLNIIVAGDQIDADDRNNNWLLEIMHDVAHEVIGWFWQSYNHFSHSFRLAMEQHQPRLLIIWMDAVHQIVSEMQDAVYNRNVQQFAKNHEIAFDLDEKETKKCAFGRLREYLKTGNDRPGIKISKLMRTSDGATVQITWSKEVAKEPVKVICMYNCDPAQMSLLGTIEFEPGFVVRKLATVKIETVVAIFVKEDKTLVRRNQFSQSNVSAAPLHVDVRIFPRACSLCSIRASDRRVAFLFGVGEGSLGSIAFCRFNESFTSVEATQTIDIGASFGMAGPLVDILLTERSLCVVDENGDIQSFDVRTRRTSKKASCGNNNVDDDGNWVGGLLSFADELVVGRAKLVGNKQLRVCSISNEDHRALPSAVLGMDMPSTELAVGSMGDVLYVVSASDGTIYSSQLSVTVRSDAYRIQRSGNGAKSSQGCLQANQKGTATQHWLRLFYHVFEKFPVRSLIDMSMSPDKLFSLTLEIAADGHSEENHFATSDAKAVCVEYLNRVMVDLRRLNKPLCGLDLVKNLTYRCSELTGNHTCLQFTSMQRFVLALVSFVPVQICRAEDNMLRLLQNGQNIANSAKSFSPTNSGDEGDASGTDAAKIAQTIRFGLLSPLLESWNGRCVVVTSMGKQSTGKVTF